MGCTLSVALGKEQARGFNSRRLKRRPKQPTLLVWSRSSLPTEGVSGPGRSKRRLSLRPQATSNLNGVINKCDNPVKYDLMVLTISFAVKNQWEL